MSDRTDYMRNYMRARRARLKAERLAASGESTPSLSASSTEGQEETTEETELAAWPLWAAGGLIAAFIGGIIWLARNANG